MTPANGRVAAAHLQGQVQAERYVTGRPRRVAVPVADLLRAPGGARERQVLWGAEVTAYDEDGGWAFVQAARDGYVGYLPAAALAPARAATHQVAVPATHLYAEANLKSPDLHHLSFGAQVTVTAEHPRFWETPEGFVPRPHLRPVSEHFDDPAEVARLHLGVPYLWGGNSILGIDCSGLVQAALLACGIACPGDSDMQLAALGEDATGLPPQRGDLWFWKGHVAMLADPQTLIHANGHRMATAFEPLEAAIARIEAQGEGPVTGCKRL